MTNRGFQAFQREYQSVFGLSAAVTFILSLALMFSDTCSKKVPLNYILLGLFTLCESYTVSMITSFYDPHLVVSALFLTAAVVAGLAIYALTTKTEISYFGGLITNILMGSLALFVLRWLLGSYFGGFEIMEFLALAGSSALAGLYFIYDIKLIAGNDRRKLSLDDYIRGALFLYVDIIRIFLKILELLTKLSKDEDEKKKKKKSNWTQGGEYIVYMYILLFEC